MIVLRDERNLLQDVCEEVNDTSLYPDGFSAARFTAIVEGNELWSMLPSAGHTGDPPPAAGR